MEDSTETGNVETSGRAPASVGRRLGTIAYWIILIYILGAGALSIIPQAFGFGGGDPASDSENKAQAAEH
jgi:hypothetical protein